MEKLRSKFKKTEITIKDETRPLLNPMMQDKGSPMIISKPTHARSPVKINLVNCNESAPPSRHSSHSRQASININIMKKEQRPNVM
jgi:hypothetical protein